MTLEATLENLDNVPEHLREHYTEQNGRYTLSVNGMKSEADVEALTTAFNKRISEALAKLEKRNEHGNLSDDDLEKAAEKFLKKMTNAGLVKPAPNGGNGAGDPQRVADLERELEAEKRKAAGLLTEKDAAVTARIQAVKENAVAGAVAESAPRKESATIVAKMATDYFEVAADGTVKSKLDCEFGPDQTPTQVFEKMKTDPRFAPFWPASKGGGAGGGGAGNGQGGGAGDKNPWTRAHWNVTQQSQLRRSDANKANELAKAAGVAVSATRQQAEQIWKQAS